MAGCRPRRGGSRSSPRPFQRSALCALAAGEEELGHRSAAVVGGLASIRLALLGGYALGVVEQLVIGYVDPQYNLIIALVVMLVLIGWRSRGELAV